APAPPPAPARGPASRYAAGRASRRAIYWKPTVPGGPRGRPFARIRNRIVGRGRATAKCPAIAAAPAPPREFGLNAAGAAAENLACGAPARDPLSQGVA